MAEHRLALVGFGSVGQALARLLLQKRDELAARYGLDWNVVGLATAHHGIVSHPTGLDLNRALELAAAGDDLGALEGTRAADTPLQLIQACGADVLFENTPVDYATGQPAVAHLETALQVGMHAITANKGPVVHAYRRLTELANQHGVCFAFESTVMDGAPVFSLWAHTLPAARLNSFRGVLNSTTNLILGLMEDGRSFEEAVSYAQSIGIAETDPSGDIDGWDAAVKVSALVTVMMDQPMTPDQVDREGIRGVSRQAVDEAAASGQRWKLVCAAHREGEAVVGSVHPERLSADDPLYGLNGTSAAISFQTDVLGPLTVTEDDPGPQTTAYGLLADFVRATTT